MNQCAFDQPLVEPEDMRLHQRRHRRRRKRMPLIVVRLERKDEA